MSTEFCLAAAHRAAAMLAVRGIADEGWAAQLLKRRDPHAGSENLEAGSHRVRHPLHRKSIHVMHAAPREVRRDVVGRA